MVVFVLGDLGLWVFLRHSDRFGFKTRLLLDTIDITVWSLAPYPAVGSYILAVLVGFPLALEAGLRLGLSGLVVPVVALASTMAAWSLAGRPLLPLVFSWLVLGVGLGVLLRRYIARLDRQSLSEWAQHQSAKQRTAYLAGQNAIAMGASSVVDAIEGVLPILGRPEPGSALEKLGGAWKPALYQSTRGHAAYLAPVLAEWTGEHNRHPDLASRVQLDCPEGVGTTLLTSDQAVVLAQRLSDLDLLGTFVVTLEDPAASQRPPGGPLSLRVGAHQIGLPADPNRPPRSCDVGPAAFVLVAFLMLSDMLWIPLRPAGVVPAMMLSLLAAWWAHRALRRLGTAAWQRIMVAAIAVSLIYAVSAVLGLKHPRNSAGLENYPVATALDLLAVLTAMYWHGLRPSIRRVAPVVAVLVVASSWVLHPAGHHPEWAVFQAFWTLPLLLGALRLRRELALGLERHSRRLLAENAETLTAEFGRGMGTVIDLVRAARDDAHAQLTAVQTKLSPQLASNARQRLEEVDRRLERMVSQRGGPSSSMTTS